MEDRSEENRKLPLNVTDGFRHDPTAFVREDRTVAGATVRAAGLGEPLPGDAEILAGRIDELLADQREDGALSDHELHAVGLTGTVLLELLDLGASSDDPRIARAVECIIRGPGEEHVGGSMSVYNIHALCRMGLTDAEALRPSIRWYVENAETWIGPHQMCPWTPAVQLQGLWAARALDEDIEPLVARSLATIAEGLNAAGCLGYNDPWGYLGCAALIDHPSARAIAEKQVAMILRSQRPDGGWGYRSLTVFRALRRHGLLAPLAEAPPLPADWRVARSIPAPAGELFSMTFDGSSLWVYDGAAGCAVAVSPRDGGVARRLKLPVEDVRAVGWWDGALAATWQDAEQAEWEDNSNARKLLRIDPITGQVKKQLPLVQMHDIAGVAQVGQELVVADAFLNAVGIFRPRKPGKPRIRTLGAPGTIHLAAAGGAVWHSDWLLTEILFKSDLDGRLLEWGTKPFDGDVAGLAHDGRLLWALDARAGQIHALEKPS